MIKGSTHQEDTIKKKRGHNNSTQLIISVKVQERKKQ